jgi:site-specific recombinase XerC
MMLTATTGRRCFERYLTPAEEKTLFAHVHKSKHILARRDRAWMLLIRHTGLRITSLELLDVADAERAIAGAQLRVRPETAKNGKGYDVPLNDSAREALRELVRIHRQMGGEGMPASPLLLSRRGQRLKVRTLQVRMTLWVRGAGLPHRASPHWLRHTLAKRIIARSGSPDPLGIVQVALGHSDRNSTGIYALPDREQVLHALRAAA